MMPIDIRNMPAGREMDALVAEKVMGFRREKTPPDINKEYGGEDILVPPNIDHSTWNYQPKGKIALTYFVPEYSKDIVKAWEVAVKMRDMWTKATDGVAGDEDFAPPFDDDAFFGYLHRYADRRWPWAFLYVTPLAICRAALLAVGADK